MGYYVKYKELQGAQTSIFKQINQWSEELENAKQKIEAVASMEEIKGEAANSIKSYMQEVHIPLLVFLQQLLTEYIARMLIYGNEYYKIDTKLNAKIAQDRLDEQITYINTGVDAFQTIESSVATAVGMVAGLADVSTPSGERITGSYERLNQKAVKLMNEIGDCEYSHLSADFGIMEDMLAGIMQILNGQRGKGNVTIATYQAGSIAKVPAFQKLQETAAKQSSNLEGGTKELEDAINGYTKRQQEKDLADQRTKEGQTQILEGALLAVAAVASAVAIVATFGAATPVVVGAFAVAATSGLYGMSNANEGINNVMLGRSGDSTTVAMNPIRDTVFASNPGIYYTVGNMSTMTCTLAVPIGGAASIAMKAGTSVTRAIAVEGGKIAISSVAGTATTDAVYKKTNNQLFATIAGMGVGTLAYGGMMKYDSAKNLSGYYTKATVENAANRASTLKDTDNYNSFRDLMSPEDVARYDKYFTDKITSIPKGERPSPSTYLSNEYIDAHLAQFDDGASIIMTKEQYVTYVNGNDYIGIRSDGTQFVLPKNVCDEIVAKTGGGISDYETALGFDSGHFEDGGGLVRIDIKNVDDLNLRLPSGNEAGANNHWIPGGYTDGGVPEAISDLIPNKKSNITIKEIK